MLHLMQLARFFLCIEVENLLETPNSYYAKLHDVSGYDRDGYPRK